MSELWLAAGLSLAAGASIPVGAGIAAHAGVARDWSKLEIRHTIMAFGGGAMIAAVALVLVPEGVRELDPVAATGCFVSGGLLFMAADRGLARRGGAASQLMAMLLDFVPEAMALGATLVRGGEVGYLLAFLIGLQNLPEGFNAFRELEESAEFRPRSALAAFWALPILGPISAWIGGTVLVPHPAVLGAVMLVAAGGILYLIFQDIAPKVPLERDGWPAQGAIAGFALGLLGALWTSGR